MKNCPLNACCEPEEIALTHNLKVNPGSITTKMRLKFPTTLSTSDKLHCRKMLRTPKRSKVFTFELQALETNLFLFNVR